MAKDKPKPTEDGIVFDSDEELDFHYFLKDCALYGLVEDIVYQPEQYELTSKATRQIWKTFKSKPPEPRSRHMFHPHVYTADWSIVWTSKFFEVFPHAPLLLVDATDRQSREILDLQFCTKQGIFRGWGIVDVKGAYNAHGGDRLFPVHQKWMWDKFGIPLTKIIPQEFFQKLGAVPNKVKWIKNRKKPTPKKAYQTLPTIDQIFST